MRSVGLPGDYSRCLDGLRRLRQLGSFGPSQDEPPCPVDEPHKDRSITVGELWRIRNARGGKSVTVELDNELYVPVSQP
jgi:hypothetical protein